MPLRVGVIGYGAMGRHHARNLRSLSDDVEVVGVADPMISARLDAAAGGFKVFEDHTDLLRAGVDAVVISVPTGSHEAVACECIDASCAVLVEKPIAADAAAGERIIERAKRKGVPLMIGYVERYNPAVVAAKEFVKQGNVGEVLSMNARRVGTFPPRVRDANVLVDIGVHDIDAVAFVTEKKLRLISAQGGKALLEDRVDHAMLALAAGKTAAVIETNWVTPIKRRELTVTGTRGYVHIDYMKQEALFAPGRDFAPTASYETLVAQYNEGQLISLPVQKEEPLRRELRAFIAGLQGAPLPDPAIALESLRIAEEATAAIEGTSKVTVLRGVVA
jgi:UDP-N-acetylglucosamine 3-dehydrogenase